MIRNWPWYVYLPTFLIAGSVIEVLLFGTARPPWWQDVLVFFALGVLAAAIDGYREKRGERS